MSRRRRKIIDTNRRAEELLGCGRGQILGRNQLRFLPLNSADAESALPVKCQMVRDDGGSIPVEVRNTWLALYGRTLILRLCRELTSESKN